MLRCQVKPSSIASSGRAAPNIAAPGDSGSVQSLLHAFRSFTAASTSLESSYSQLRAEVERLHTELSAKDEELLQAQDRLRREQCLAEVSTLLAHEIRNPLGSLELFAGLLADSELSPECSHWVEHLQAGLRSLGATVNNVLQFHGAPRLECSQIDLGEFLESTRNFLLPLARQSNVVLGLQNRLAGVLLRVDHHRLQQVMFNLILNGVRAMPQGGWIEVGGHVLASRTVALVVADTGPGIAPENLPKIFEAGFSTRAGSPGLGLTVCRRIVEQHGGSITAESDPKRGTKFTILLPFQQTQMEKMSA